MINETCDEVSFALFYIEAFIHMVIVEVEGQCRSLAGSQSKYFPSSIDDSIPLKATEQRSKIPIPFYPWIGMQMVGID